MIGEAWAGKGQLVGIVSMDLSKAFDVIQHSLLLAKIKVYGLDRNSCALLRDYMSHRQQRVKIGDMSASLGHSLPNVLP